MSVNFDHKVLSESNLLIHKWLKILNLKRKDVFRFISNCKLDNFSIYAISDEQLADLKADMQIFRYTINIENELIEKFKPMLYFVAKKMKISTLSHDHISNGLIGIRKAIYYYIKPEISFKSYCFTGIVTAFKQVYSSKRLIDHHTVKATDIGKNRNFVFDREVHDNASGDPTHQVNFLQENLDELAKLAKFTELEKLVMYQRLTNVSNDTSNWAKKLIEEHNLTCTMCTVYRSFKSASAKLKNVLGE